MRLESRSHLKTISQRKLRMKTEYRSHIDNLDELATALRQREPTFAAQLNSFIKELKSPYD